MGDSHLPLVRTRQKQCFFCIFNQQAEIKTIFIRNGFCQHYTLAESYTLQLHRLIKVKYNKNLR